MEGGAGKRELAEARAAWDTGHLNLALRLALELPERFPLLLEGVQFAGAVAAQVGDSGSALKFLRLAEKADPGHFETVFWLSAKEREAGHSERAIELATRATELQPGDAHAQMNLGFCWFEGGRFEEAFQCFEVASGLEPGLQIAWEMAGMALKSVGRHSDSERWLQTAWQVGPQRSNLAAGIGESLFRRGCVAEGLSWVKRGLAIDAGCANCLRLRIDLELERGSFAKAEEWIDRLHTAHPEDASALSLKAVRLQARGLVEEAKANWWSALRQDPLQGFPYYALAHAKPSASERQALLEDALNGLANPRLGLKTRAYLHYAAAKLREDGGAFESAMEHLDLANPLTRLLHFGNRPFDSAAYRANVDWTIRTFSSPVPEGRLPEVCTVPQPIFVVGMMRSGTSLVEQILTASPGVASVGEERFWQTHWSRCVERGGTEINLKCLRRVGREYQEMVAHRCRDTAFGKAEFVVDKMPGNYALLGFLKIALPHAIFVQVKRHPVGTCVSIYSRGEAFRVPFANRKADLVFAYREYVRLTDHWRRTIPMVEVEYERLVADPEAVARRVVAECGLRWDDACAHPERNPNPMNTPSADQVRHPIDDRAAERWRGYVPWLGDFATLL